MSAVMVAAELALAGCGGGGIPADPPDNGGTKDLAARKKAQTDALDDASTKLQAAIKALQPEGDDSMVAQFNAATAALDALKKALLDAAKDLTPGRTTRPPCTSHSRTFRRFWRLRGTMGSGFPADHRS